MKSVTDNLKSSWFLKVVAVLFIVKFILDLVNCVKYDSFQSLLSGTVNNVTNTLILYALGVIIKDKEPKKTTITNSNTNN